MLVKLLKYSAYNAYNARKNSFFQRFVTSSVFRGLGYACENSLLLGRRACDVREAQAVIEGLIVDVSA
jgi:hypothetical protein